MSRYIVGRKLLWVFLITGLALTSLSGTERVQADPLTLKWRIDDLAETWLAPLTADLDGDGVKEIVFTGVASDGTGGYVYAIDGRTGEVKWKIRSTDYNKFIGIGTHSPFEITDLDLDGSPEILVCA